MAAASMPAPGTEYGPCNRDACEHTDCAAAWHDAETVCPLCTESIGFGRRYYHDHALGLVHALCYEELATAKAEKR